MPVGLDVWPGDAGEQAHVELATDRRRNLDRVLHRLVEAVDARPHHVLDRERKADLRVARPADASLVTDHDPALAERRGDLFERERVAFRLLPYPREQVGR